MKGKIFRRMSAFLASAAMAAGLLQPVSTCAAGVVLPAETLAAEYGETEAGPERTGTGGETEAGPGRTGTGGATDLSAGSSDSITAQSESQTGEEGAQPEGQTDQDDSQHDSRTDASGASLAGTETSSETAAPGTGNESGRDSDTEKESGEHDTGTRPDQPVAGFSALPDEIYLTEYTESESGDMPADPDDMSSGSGKIPEEELSQTEAETETELTCFTVSFEEAEGCSMELSDDREEYAPGEEVTAYVKAMPEHAIDEVSAEYDGQLVKAGATNVTAYATGEDQDHVHFQMEDLSAAAAKAGGDEGGTSYELKQELTESKKITFNMPASNVVMRAKSHKIDIPGVSSFTLESAYSDDTTLGEDRTVNYIDDGKVKSTTVKMTNTFAKIGDNENSTAMKVVDFKNDKGKVVFSSLAYCLQPDKTAPENGDIKDSNISPLDTSGTSDRRIYKIMYYMYRGPAWGDTIDGVNLKKKIKSLGFTKLDGSDPGNAQYYNVTHFVLAAAYDPDHWNDSSVKGHFFDSDGKKAIKSLLKTIDSLPEPETALSAASVGSSNQGDGVYSSPITFRTSIPSNWAKFTLPAGYGLLITDTGDRIEPAETAQTARVGANQTFRVINTTGIEGTGTFDITTRYASEYDPFKIRTVPAQQNISFSYMASTGLSFQVEWTVPEYGAVRIRKADSRSGFSYAQGDAVMDGAVFQIISDSDDPVFLSTDPKTPHAKGDVLAEITTDEQGYASTAPGLITSGSTLIIREKSPTRAGYKLLEKDITASIPSGKDTTADLAYDDSLIPERVITGGISVRKCDWNLEEGPEGGAAFQGAEFTVTNVSKNPVIVNGHEVQPGSEACVLTTDPEGYAESGNILPYGTYEVTERSAPEGYLINEGKATVCIREEGVTVAAAPEDSTVPGVWVERPILFDIKIEKFRDYAQNDDSISDTLIPLEGAKFDIISMNERTVCVAGKSYASGQVVATLETDSKGIASTRSIDDKIESGTLPYGIYKIHESYTPDGLSKVGDFEVNGTLEGGVSDGYEYTGIYKNDRPVETPVQIAKKDAETGQAVGIAGTVFEILESDGKTPHVFHAVGEDGLMKDITDFTIPSGGTCTLPNKLGYGTWYIHEIKAPLGYVLPKEDTKFEVSKLRKWGDYQLETLKDTPQKFRIRIQKTDALTGKSLAGAVFSVTAAEDIMTGDGTVRIRKGEVADTVTVGEDGTGMSRPLYLGVVRKSSEDGSKTSLKDEKPGDLLLRGEYDVTEIQAPLGFARNREPVRVSAVSPDMVTEIFETDTLKAENPPTTLKIFKHDPSGQGIGGIEFELKRIGGNESPGVPADGTTDSGTTDGGTYRTGDDGSLAIRCILPGIYSLRESKTLPGYLQDNTIRYFTVDRDGYIFRSDSEGKQTDDQEKTSQISLDWVNDVTKIQISKRDITDSKEVPGAVLVIRDAEGQTVDQWTTDGTPHYTEKLPAGSYTLTEITAPMGYQQAETVPFTVEETGEIQKVFMYDAPVETEPPTEPETSTEPETAPESKHETKKPRSTEKETQPSAAPAPSPQTPRTGDDTDFRGLMPGILAGILLLAGSLMLRKAGGKGRRRGR